MVSVSRPYRLINPGHKRKRSNAGKRMSLAQKLHFGTKRQRAAAALSLKGKGKRKKAGPARSLRDSYSPFYHTSISNKGKRKNTKYLGKAGPLKSLGGKRGYVYSNKGKRKNVRYVRSLGTNYYVVRKGQKTASQGAIPGYLYSNPGRKRRKKNVGEILTVFNPGTRRKKGTNIMAKRKRKNSLFGRARRRIRRLRPRRNPVAIRKVRYQRRRRGNPSVRRYKHYTRRRNPDFLSGEVGVIAGVVGGATVTNLLMGTLQSTVSAVSSGIPAYIAGALVAFLQGKLVGKFTKNPALGKYMSAGGYTWVALTMLHDFMPSFPNPFASLNGMGMLTTTNNWGPLWSNTPNSMTRFVKPGGFNAALPPPPVATGGMHGFGRLRRAGRMA